MRLTQTVDGNEARDALLERHALLAEYLARRFAGRGEPFEDLVQVANIGLLKAADRFDPDRGVEFGTYATPTILGELKRHFRDEVSWPVRIPRRLQELGLRVRLCLGDLHQELGRSPTVPEIAARTGLSEEEVLEVTEADYAFRPVSLDAANGTDVEPHEYLGDVDPSFEVTEDWATLRPALARLPERERAILVLRFFDDLTQSQIADELGISQMHVSRLLARSLQRLREAIEEAEDEAQAV